MVLDTENQRNILLHIVNSIQLTGNMEDMRKTVRELDALKKQISEAKVSNNQKVG